MSDAGAPLLSARALAALLGCSLDWLYRNRRRLERETGFPEPLLRGHYDPLAIKAWRLSRLAPALRAELAAANDAADADGWGAELDRRAQALAVPPLPAFLTLDRRS